MTSVDMLGTRLAGLIDSRDSHHDGAARRPDWRHQRHGGNANGNGIAVEKRAAEREEAKAQQPGTLLHALDPMDEELWHREGLDARNPAALLHDFHSQACALPGSGKAIGSVPARGAAFLSSATCSDGEGEVNLRLAIATYGIVAAACAALTIALAAGVVS